MNKNNIWKCDIVTAVTVSHFWKYGKLFWIQYWCFENMKWLFCDPYHTCKSFVTFVTIDKWPQKIFVNVTVRQRSQRHKFQKLFLLIFWCHKCINNVRRLLCDTCHKSRWFMALENEPIVMIEDGTVWQLSHCHTLFAYKCWVCTQKNQPTVTKCVCINPSHSHGESKTEKWYFIKEIWAFH